MGLCVMPTVAPTGSGNARGLGLTGNSRGSLGDLLDRWGRLKLLDIAASYEVEAQRLAEAYADHFHAVDQRLTYTHSEREMSLELERDVWLVGVVDAAGTRELGEPFFREDKTANPRLAKTWKRHWVMSPQALTYGLLAAPVSTFLVRKAFKSDPATFDHEWFTFDGHDLAWWRVEVLRIAREIAWYRNDKLARWWPLNIEHGCFAYGDKHPCQFFADGCSKGDWSTPPKVSMPKVRGGVAAAILSEHPNAIVLSPSGIKTWMRCREMFRRMYEPGGVVEPESEAMLLGKRFHELTAKYTRSLITGGSDGNN